MAEDWHALRDWLDISENNTDLEAHVTRAWALASEKVDHVIARAKKPVPAIIREEAIVLAGANIYNFRSAKNGISTMAAEGGAPLRLSGEVMREAMRALQPYLGIPVG